MQHFVGYVCEVLRHPKLLWSLGTLPASVAAVTAVCLPLAAAVTAYRVCDVSVPTAVCVSVLSAAATLCTVVCIRRHRRVSVRRQRIAADIQMQLTGALFGFCFLLVFCVPFNVCDCGNAVNVCCMSVC